MKILVCDDSETIRILIGSYLHKMGHEVIYADSGVQAITLFNEISPELLLIDVEMPGMDGYETTKKIRQSLHEFSQWTPIIFLSAHVDDASLVKGIEAGGDDYLTKPVSSEVLNAKVHAMKRLVSMRRNIIDLTNKLQELNQKLIEYNKILSDLSLKDPLTDLGNRRAFEEILKREHKHAERENTSLCLMMIDVDKFKLYNDTYGHQAGDECLKQVGLVLKTGVHRSTDFVARYGGEEFVIILPNSPLKDALHVAERVRQQVEALQLENKSAPSKIVTISVGVAENDKQTTSAEALVKAADAALYEAKARGRNKVFSYSEFSTSIQSSSERGFTLLGVVASVAITGILAAIAIVNYQSYLIRSRTAELLNIGSSAKVAVVGYRMSHQTMPSTNEEAGVSNVVSGYASSLAIGPGGVITVTGNQTNLGTGGPFSITLTPTALNGVVEWDCTASGTTQYAPTTCRGITVSSATGSANAGSEEGSDTTGTTGTADTGTGTANSTESAGSGTGATGGTETVGTGSGESTGTTTSSGGSADSGTEGSSSTSSSGSGSTSSGSSSGGPGASGGAGGSGSASNSSTAVGKGKGK